MIQDCKGCATDSPTVAVTWRPTRTDLGRIEAQAESIQERIDAAVRAMAAHSSSFGELPLNLSRKLVVLFGGPPADNKTSI